MFEAILVALEYEMPRLRNITKMRLSNIKEILFILGVFI